VDIRVVSSLTSEDEDRFASLVMKAISDLMATVPIAYSVRIETGSGKILQQSRGPFDGIPLPLRAVRNRKRDSTRR